MSRGYFQVNKILFFWHDTLTRWEKQSKQRKTECIKEEGLAKGSHIAAGVWLTCQFIFREQGNRFKGTAIGPC